MPLPITIPNTFANATATIPLSQLDNNFSTVAVAVNSIGNGAFTLANAQITGGTISNVTLDNVSVDVETLSNVTITNLTVDGNATFTNAAVTANVATITTANVTTANVTNMVTGNATITGGTINVSSVIATDDVTVGDDLVFTGTGNRITGDFSNATVANRVIFQTSTVNGGTTVGAMPNGTSVAAAYQAYNATDLANTGGVAVGVNSTDVRIQSFAVGTGTALPMTFYTGGSERMRVDTSGNVGIGTSSPASYSFDTGVDLVVGDGNNSAISVVSSSAGTGYVAFADGTSGTARYSGLIEYNHTDNYLGLRTSAVERARIDSSGNLLVGTTSSSATQNGIKLVNPETNSYLVVSHPNGTGSGNFYAAFEYNAGTIGTIVQSGTTAVAYNTSSDYRLKHDIQPMTGALAKVAQLKPVTYKWNVDDSESQGFIAHELQAVVPDCVTGEKDAMDADGNPVYQGIDTSFLVATLTAAIQEQQAMIEELKAKVAALEEK
jgi:hypothetical protein